MWSASVLSALGVLVMVHARAPSLDVYDDKGEKGNKTTFYKSTGKMGDWNDRGRSVCITGFWVMFSVEDFFVNSYRLWGLGAPNCLDLEPYYLDQTLSSLRQVGDPDDIDGKSLCLFAQDFYSGDMTYLAGDTPSIPNGGDFASAVVSGKQKWSIYSEENYGGDVTCLDVQDAYYPVFGWFQNTGEMGDVGGNVRSARMGCPSTAEPVKPVSGPIGTHMA